MPSRFCPNITMTSQWARWRLKLPTSQLFTQPFVQMQIKENIKAPRHWPLWGEIHWSPVNSPHKGQWRGKCLHWMTSSLTRHGYSGDYSKSLQCHVSVMASQIISNSIVCYTACKANNKENIKARKSPVTGGFPSQRASKAESISTSWRKHAIPAKLVAPTGRIWQRALWHLAEDFSPHRLSWKDYWSRVITNAAESYTGWKGGCWMKTRYHLLKRKNMVTQ